MSNPRNSEGAPAAAGALEASGRRRQATVIATLTSSSSGTATRSVRATQPGPPATTSVDSTPMPNAHQRSESGPPQSAAHADAAITLLIAIQAKLITYISPAISPAPRMPNAARAAMIEGTPSRGPSGASAATISAPARLPAIIKDSAVRVSNEPARLAPTANVVATMFAPAQIRKRSSGDWFRSASGTGPISTGFKAEASVARGGARRGRRGPPALLHDLDADAGADAVGACVDHGLGGL